MEQPDAGVDDPCLGEQCCPASTELAYEFFDLANEIYATNRSVLVRSGPVVVDRPHEDFIDIFSTPGFGVSREVIDDCLLEPPSTAEFDATLFKRAGETTVVQSDEFDALFADGSLYSTYGAAYAFGFRWPVLYDQGLRAAYFYVDYFPQTSSGFPPQLRVAIFEQVNGAWEVKWLEFAGIYETMDE